MILQLPQDDQQVIVLFRLSARIWADHIHLVGDFNGWNTSATPMRLGEQYWEARLILPVGGRYYYAYLVDGYDWCTEVDIWAPKTEFDPPLVTMLPVAIPQANREVSSRRREA